MSLHPITKSRHSRKTRGAYRSLRSREQWKPWIGWNYHVSKNPLDWFGSKRFVLGIVALSIIIGGMVLAQGPLFHSIEAQPCIPTAEELRSHIPCGDPQQYLWQATSPNTDTSEFNVVKATETTLTVNGYNSKALQLTANATQTALAISASPVTDIGIVSGKNLLIGFSWAIPSGCCTLNNAWGFFLTTNSTPNNTNQLYRPINDPSVVFIADIFSGSANNFEGDLLIQRAPNIAINSISSGCSPASTCYMVGTFTSPTINPSADLIQEQIGLNFTGAGPGTQHCVGTVGNACSSWFTNDYQTTNQIVRSSVLFPWMSLAGPPLYVGFFSTAGMGHNVDFTFNLSNGSMSIQTFSFSPDSCTAANPCPQTQRPTIDTGGFFGPIIKALIGLGVFILQSIFSFFAFLAGVLGPVLSKTFSVLEQFVETVLNFIGNALGFGNVGTQLITFLSQVVTFFTSFLPNALTNFPTFMSRFFDYLNIVFPILPSAFATALTVLTFAVNGISQALTIFIFSIQFIAAAYAFFLIFSFMVFTADDALGGVVEYLGTAEALAFFLIKWAALLTNLGLDIGTWIIGLIPKPFIQMAAARLPRIPILESSARIILPSFDFGELRSGNLLSPWLWTLGLWFDTWYESRNPALPGSLCQLVSGTCTNMQLLSNLLPLMQVFVFMSSGVLALWLVMRPLELLGADLGIFESIGVGLGRKPVGGPGGISIAKSQKHFQGRLQKAVEKQKGVQGFKALGPFSSGAKLEKGVGTKETVSTASLFE